MSAPTREDCDICGQYHVARFEGDCRDNTTRFDDADDARDMASAELSGTFRGASDAYKE